MHRRTFVRRTAQSALAFGVLRELSACHRGPKTATHDAAFIALRDRYFLQALGLNPVTATYLGGDGYSASLADINGKLRDYRAPALEAEGKFYQNIQTELGAIAPETLGPVARIDHDVLHAQLNFVRHQLTELRHHERSVDTYVAEPFRGVDWQIQGMTDGAEGLRGSETEWKLVTARVQGIPAYLEAARANLLAGKSEGNIPDHRMVEKDGLTGSAANAQYFRDTLLASAKSFLGSQSFAQSTLTALAAAGAEAAQAWEQFSRFLGDTYDPKDKTDRYAIGEREYDWRLKNCLRLFRSTTELYDYGAQQVALYEAKLVAVAQEVASDAKLKLSFGDDAARRTSVRAVMAYLSKDSPKDDDELFQWYREAGERAVAYGREQQLFGIPDTYRLDVTPTPPVLRSTIDAAYYPAPPFKQTGVGRFYLTPTGNDPAALRLNNRSSVADTAVHEGFPGHDWHYKFMTQHRSQISNIRWFTPGSVEDSAAMWQDSMATEGWALYAEELMSEPVSGKPHGFYTAAEHLYELQGQLLRSVRVRVDLGIHTGQLSFADAVDYFTEHVTFYPHACARANSDPEARAVCDQASRALYRYSKWPTQAITYNLGKSAIVRLRESYRKRQGNAYSAREFHERLMTMGTIPANYYREEFLNG